MVLIRKTRQADLAATLAIINEAAQAYRGVIPADRWREPYMPPDELEREIADGVMFWIAEEDGRLLGVMGIQDKGEVALVRHAYVLSTMQRKGVGTRLLRHVEGLTGKPVLIGTWADASWAIRPEQAQRLPAPEILVNPRATDRNVGCTCRWTMDGSPGAGVNSSQPRRAGFTCRRRDQAYTLSEPRLNEEKADRHAQRS